MQTPAGGVSQNPVPRLMMFQAVPPLNVEHLTCDLSGLQDYIVHI